MTAPLTEGIHDNVPAEVYHADPCEAPSLSCSIAWKLLDRSAAHAREAHPRLNPDFEPEVKDIYDLGSSAHNMVLRQDSWREDIEVVDAVNWRTKAAKEAKEAARAAGRHPVLRGQFTALEAMATALEGNPEAGRCFTDGRPEQSLIWRDKATGALCRCRPDWMPSDPTDPWPDYKTTTDARVGKWDRRFIIDHGGALRAGFYAEGIMRACGLKKPPLLYYVVQEVAAPYPVVARVVQTELLERGQRMFRKAVGLWAQCLEADHWPGYPFIDALSVSQYMLDRLDEEYPK